MLRVGVKTDFSPYNSLNAQGEVVGFENDSLFNYAEKAWPPAAERP